MNDGILKRTFMLPYRQWLLTICGLLVLAFLAGCGGGARVHPEPAPVKSKVSHFDEGRSGFVITETAPDDVSTTRDFDRAVDLLQASEYEEAILLLETVIEQAPDLTAPRINLGMAYRLTEQPGLAEEHLLRALEVQPGHPVAGSEYGLLLRRDGRFTEARDVLETVLEHYPEYLPARKNLGILCDLYLDDPECALEQYRRYLSDGPEDEKVEIWIASLQIRLGQAVTE